MKYLIIIISALLAQTHSAVANYPFRLYQVVPDSAVIPANELVFMHHILAGGNEYLGGEEEFDQDGKSKKKKNAATSKTKRAASPTEKLASLTPDEENMITDLKTKKVTKAIGIELSAPLQFKYAILLDVAVESFNDAQLLELIESWYGTKYKFGGETREGTDCSGFVRQFMLSYYDVTLPRRSQDQYSQTTHIKKAKLVLGDLVFFKTNGAKGGITHVGIYLCNNKFVHAATSGGVMINDLDEDYYKARFASGGRTK